MAQISSILAACLLTAAVFVLPDSAGNDNSAAANLARELSGVSPHVTNVGLNLTR
ncbi:hypothetical protein [Aquamicrobium sp. LC103]|uniref:hypothetical protein n=1 Tax=Aquamicrobium sp. LC103 TaxID=1120658 RepID=UPI000AD884ED|nr:hypothetical protein [Aquamicrobium sp. LC103]